MKEKDESEAKFRRLVRDLESELGSVRKTIQILQPRLLDAIKDRKAFELERDKAVEAARHAADRLEQSKHEIETLRATKAELESKLAGVAHSGSNAGTDGAVEPDGGAKEYLEASAKIKALENKISRLNQDMDFIRGEYQNASSKASALGVENAELSERIKELEGIASEARIRTRQINAEKTVQELQRQLSHQQRLTQEREKEIERLRDEIRALRNGRRETRQSSVPRSPRMSVMSPRPGRIPAGAGMAPNGSRGTSPGPVGSWDPASGAGMPFLNPVPGNGRWGHLRD